MVEDEEDVDGAFYCELCGRRISREEYETYDGLCAECYEMEIADLDMEDDC
jgi:NMD protein affecting ribosome stability and mRNA decay